jgi:hypothetical protein
MALRSKLPLFACASAAVAACVAACGSSSSSASPASAEPRVFIGQVDGSDARVGVVATGHSARIYFCGGDGTFTTMTHWFPSVPFGTSGRDLAPTGATAGWSIAGEVDDAGASGMVTTTSGSGFAFHAAPVAAGTIAGLYEAAGPCGKVGLIVAQGSAGEEPVGQGACVPATGGASPEQVNPIRPIQRAADGTIAVVVDGVQVPVHAAAAPAD